MCLFKITGMFAEKSDPEKREILMIQVRGTIY